MFEPLEPRQLLDGALPEALDGVAIIPPVDTSVLLGLAQAAPVVGQAAVVSAFPLGQTFELHSKTGALKVIYLDFDGHTTTGTYWNNPSRPKIVTPKFSIDSDINNFSEAELARIQYIWQRVAEDFIPFNVDVTTQDPGVFAITKDSQVDTRYGIRVCIGGDSSWYGAVIGGIALEEPPGFGPDSDTPCFVFSDNLGTDEHGREKDVSEAISHEVGHTLGLSHDGTTAGVKYYTGQGSGPTGWAPIMGIGYYKELTQWDKGEYFGANNQQDDLDRLASSYPGGFGYRADDHGSTRATADGLAVAGDMSVSGSGIIGRTTDVDFFSFTTGLGLVDLWINPAPRGPNLDILATLYDSSGAVITTSNPIDALDARITLSLPAGTYYLSIDGTGKGDPLATGYSDYGSLGQYSISGTIVDLPVVTIVASDALAGEWGLDAGAFTVSRTGGTAAAMEVFYSVSGSAGNGVDYQQIPLSVTIPAGSASTQITIAPINDSLREGEETVVLTVQSGAGFFVGAPGSATVRIADDDFMLSTNNFALSELTTYGSVIGAGLSAALASDNVYEQLREQISGTDDYSLLEHRWTFSVTAGGRVTFFVEAYRPDNADGDDFTFAYSTNGTAWTTLLTVTKATDDNKAQQAAMPEGLSGTVYIRVVDTNRVDAKSSLDSLYIDKMFIRSDPGIAGDTNVDGIVDALDYMTVKRALGMSSGAAWNDGDFDQDGDVDYADLSVLMSNFGQAFSPAPAAAPIVPEPAPIAAAAPIAVEAAPAVAIEVAPPLEPPVAPAAVLETPPLAPAPAKLPDRTMKMLAAMASAAQNARIDALSVAATRLPRPPFATQNRSALLPWWLRPKRIIGPLPQERESL